jgi:hypothetical protein
VVTCSDDDARRDADGAANEFIGTAADEFQREEGLKNVC